MPDRKDRGMCMTDHSTMVGDDSASTNGRTAGAKSNMADSS